jgi:large subunit ribosomal protein L32
MAVPKHRHTKSRRNNRRAHWKIDIPEMTTCPECGETIKPYTACSSCGKYKGKQIITIKEKVSKEKSA